MDTIKYIEKCPQCGTKIDSRWIETTRTELFVECMGLRGGIEESGIGGWHYGNQETAIFNENDSVHNFSIGWISIIAILF